MENKNSTFSPGREEKFPEQPKTIAGEASWLEQLRGRFDRFLGQEQRPGEPQISVDIFYTKHGTAKDMEALSKKIHEADVFVPEMMGWSPLTLHYLESVSAGVVSPEQIREYAEEGPTRTSWVQLMDILNGSLKPITIIDLPSHDLLAKSINETIYDLATEIYPPKPEHTFESMLRSLKNLLEDYARHQAKREQFMLHQLPVKVREIVQQHPELQKKEKIKY